MHGTTIKINILPYSQEPPICPAPQPDEYIPLSTSYLFKRWLRSFIFAHTTLRYIFLPTLSTSPACFPLLQSSLLTIDNESYKSFSSSIHSFIKTRITSSILGPIIFFTLRQCPSIHTTDQVSQPYTTTGKLRAYFRVCQCLWFL
jgi:hypothetical protein